jgi:uncharacterized protein (TIGR02271 family)
MSYIIDTTGERAEVVSQNESQVTLRLSDGQTILVPHSLLLAQNDGSFRLSHSLRGLLDNQLVALPVIEEELQVDKRIVEGGKVRVHKTVHEENILVDETLHRDVVDVQRVAVNRVIDSPAVVREEGDTTIIPVMEEIVVVEKRLVLREEIHVTRRQTETRDPQTYTVRREQVTVERVDQDI